MLLDEVKDEIEGVELTDFDDKLWRSEEMCFLMSLAPPWEIERSNRQSSQKADDSVLLIKSHVSCHSLLNLHDLFSFLGI